MKICSICPRHPPQSSGEFCHKTQTGDRTGKSLTLYVMHYKNTLKIKTWFLELNNHYLKCVDYNKIFHISHRFMFFYLMLYSFFYCFKGSRACVTSQEAATVNTFICIWKYDIMSLRPLMMSQASVTSKCLATLTTLNVLRPFPLFVMNAT